MTEEIVNDYLLPVTIAGNRVPVGGYAESAPPPGRVPRLLAPTVEDRLARFPVVVVTGARQINR